MKSSLYPFFFNADLVSSHVDAMTFFFSGKLISLNSSLLAIFSIVHFALLLKTLFFSISPKNLFSVSAAILLFKVGFTLASKCACQPAFKSSPIFLVRFWFNACNSAFAKSAVILPSATLCCSSTFFCSIAAAASCCLACNCCWYSGLFWKASNSDLTMDLTSSSPTLEASIY